LHDLGHISKGLRILGQVSRGTRITGQISVCEWLSPDREWLGWDGRQMDSKWAWIGSVLA
jgi:hypothetical protein